MRMNLVKLGLFLSIILSIIGLSYAASLEYAAVDLDKSDYQKDILELKFNESVDQEINLSINHNNTTLFEDEVLVEGDTALVVLEETEKFNETAEPSELYYKDGDWHINEGVVLYRDSNPLRLSDTAREDISIFDERDFDRLNSSNIENYDENMIEVNQRMEIGDIGQKFASEDGKLDRPSLYAKLPENTDIEEDRFLFSQEIQFQNGFKPLHTDFNDSIEMFGENYHVNRDKSLNSSSLTLDSFESRVNLSKGESETIHLNGDNYEFKNVGVTEDSAIIELEELFSLTVGDTVRINDAEIKLNDKTVEQEPNGTVELLINYEKLELREGRRVVNGDKSIRGSKVLLETSRSDESDEFTNETIIYSIDIVQDVNRDLETLLPGNYQTDRVFEAFNIHYGGIGPNPRELDSKIKLNLEDESSIIDFRDIDNKEVSIDWLGIDDKSHSLGKNSKNIALFEGQELSEDDYFILSNSHSPAVLEVFDLDYDDHQSESIFGVKNHRDEIHELGSDHFQKDPTGFELPNFLDEEYFNQDNFNAAQWVYEGQKYLVLVGKPEYSSDPIAHIVEQDDEIFELIPPIYTDQGYTVSFSRKSIDLDREYLNLDEQDVKFPSTLSTSDKIETIEFGSEQEIETESIAYSIDGMKVSVDIFEDNYDQNPGALIIQPEADSGKENAFAVQSEFDTDEREFKGFNTSYTGVIDSGRIKEDSWIKELYGDKVLGLTDYGTQTEKDKGEYFKLQQAPVQASSGFAVTENEEEEVERVIDRIKLDTTENPALELEEDENRQTRISTIKREFKQGWNYFSLPIETSQGYDIDELFDGKDIETVWTYENGEWINHHPDAEENSLESIRGGQGYIVKSNQEFVSAPVIDPSLDQINSSEPVKPAQKDLEPGWNLIGSYWARDKMAKYDEAFRNIPDDGVTEILQSRDDGDLGLESYRIPDHMNESESPLLVITIDISIGTKESNALKQSKELSKELIDGLPDSTRVGFVAYNERAYDIMEPKLVGENRKLTKDKIDNLMAEGPGFHNYGLRGAKSMIDRNEGDGNIIMFSDGKISTLAEESNVRAESQIEANSIEGRLATVGVGTEYPRELEEEDEEFLQDLANRTNNGFYTKGTDLEPEKINFDSDGLITYNETPENNIRNYATLKPGYGYWISAKENASYTKVVE